MNAQLLTLPWSVLLTFAAGYAGYYIANVGVRDHHKTVDVTFGTLVYGFFGAFFYEFLRRYAEVSMLVASLAAFAFAVLLGAIWNGWGRKLMIAALRNSRVSHSDDLPNAWMALFQRTDVATLQLTVKTTDGIWLKSDDLRKFERAPNGPCVFGGTGDLLMYVTHQMGPDDEDFEPVEGVLNADWGAEITYIPRERIARMDIRRKS